jgi:predicted Zn-dependent protease
MIGKKAIENIIDFVCSRKKQLNTQVLIHSEDSLLTRFANSTIHQNLREKNTVIAITAFIGKKEGTATTNTLTKSAIDQALERAITIAKQKPDDPDSAGPSRPRAYRDLKTYVPVTERFSHGQKAEVLKQIFNQSFPYRCFGAFTTGTTEIAIGNSKGLRAYNKGTDAILRLTIKGKNGSAFGQCAHRDIRELHCEQLHADVLARARKAQNPRKAKPGSYTVILTPEAVSNILIFLGFVGFNGLLYSEGRSCLTGKLGKRIFSRKLNLTDDPLDTRGFAFPFDLEGIPKGRLPLVQNGTVKALVHDRKTARKMNQRSTGHYSGPGTGPIPLNMVIQKGDKTTDQLRKGIKRGIEISSLHYVNVVEPLNLTLTGMTRNGTFMIQNGTLAYPVKNLRFNQSILHSLANIVGISSDIRLVEGGNTYGQRFPWGFILPSLVIDDFHFTGETEF